MVTKRLSSFGGELHSAALVHGLQPGGQGSTLSKTGAPCPQQTFIKDGQCSQPQRDSSECADHRAPDPPTSEAGLSFLQGRVLTSGARTAFVVGSVLCPEGR